jgi:hypothetical protein
MEGSWNAANQMLNGQSAVSWHFSVLKDGTVFQHYPTTSACWHSGSPANNNKYIGIEHEGKAGEPLTESQLKSSVGLVKWLAAEEGWVLERGSTLFEHNELYLTACPSGRIPWGYYLNDPNHEDNFDTGLTRIRLEDMLRLIRDEHKHSEGDPQVLHDIIDGKR